MCENTEEAILILNHGSIREDANITWRCMWETYQTRYPQMMIAGAFVEVAEPLLEHVVDALYLHGTRRIYIAPVFLTLGNHLQQTVPERLDKMEKKYADLTFVMAPPIGADPLLLDILDKRLQSVGLCVK